MHIVLNVGNKREKRSIDPQHHNAYSLLEHSCKEWAVPSAGPRVQEAGARASHPDFQF